MCSDTMWLMLDCAVKNTLAYTTEQLPQPRYNHCVSDGRIWYVKKHLSFKETKFAWLVSILSIKWNCSLILWFLVIVVTLQQRLMVLINSVCVCFRWTITVYIQTHRPQRSWQAICVYSFHKWTGRLWRYVNSEYLSKRTESDAPTGKKGGEE